MMYSMENLIKGLMWVRVLIPPCPRLVQGTAAERHGGGGKYCCIKKLLNFISSSINRRKINSFILLFLFYF